MAGKTGTAQVAGKLATSVFASFAPCKHPKYVVVMMIPDSGYGADVSGPAVRKIWDAIYGLEGHKAALPGGKLPSAAARSNQAGQIVSSAPAARATARPAGAAARMTSLRGSRDTARPGQRGAPSGIASSGPPSGAYRGLAPLEPGRGGFDSGWAPAARCRGRLRGLARRAFARESPLRHMDWILLPRCWR